MRKIVIFTGAGVSRESGLLTYRDQDGLWNGRSVAEVCSREAWERTPEVVNNFFNGLRSQVLVAEPNAAHRALAALEEDQETQVTVITQNLDDLHERGGSQSVIHVHGEIMKKRGDGDTV